MRAQYMISEDKVLEGIVTEEHDGPNGRAVDIAEAEEAAPFIRRAPIAASLSPGFAMFVVDAPAADAPASRRRK